MWLSIGTGKGNSICKVFTTCAYIRVFSDLWLFIRENHYSWLLSLWKSFVWGGTKYFTCFYSLSFPMNIHSVFWLIIQWKSRFYAVLFGIKLYLLLWIIKYSFLRKAYHEQPKILPAPPISLHFLSLHLSLTPFLPTFAPCSVSNFCLSSFSPPIFLCSSVSLPSSSSPISLPSFFISCQLISLCASSLSPPYPSHLWPLHTDCVMASST